MVGWRGWSYDSEGEGVDNIEGGAPALSTVYFSEILPEMLHLFSIDSSHLSSQNGSESKRRSLVTMGSELRAMFAI